MGIVISGIGCSLMDYLYSGIDFTSDAFEAFRSKEPGDGGLSPGRLVFTEELERFAGIKFREILRKIVGERAADSKNLGGPAIVALINAAQLLSDRDISVRFYGARGQDETGERIVSIVNRTPLDIRHYVVKDGISPFTNVFSDPNYDDGRGERTFVNNIGAAWNYGPDDLDDSFYDSHVVLFGGTALVPEVHDHLLPLLRTAKEHGAVTVVSTVYDFRNEKKNPGGRWPLGGSEEAFSYMDVLITDKEEAIKISGESATEDVARFYRDRGVKSFIVTEGAEPVYFYSTGEVFAPVELTALPVSEAVTAELAEAETVAGDTTGCGDNFVGGVIASMASQLEKAEPGSLSLPDACSWGIASGGYTCFYLGGTYLEGKRGEKRAAVSRYFRKYRDQVQGQSPLKSRRL
jgi:sugar/nucleoside kinase (ribokinase family)